MSVTTLDQILSNSLLCFLELFSSFRRNLRDVPSQFAQLNLFRNHQNPSEAALRQEHHSTRLYLVLLTSGMSVLILYYCLTQSTVALSIENPTVQTYEILWQSKEVSSLECPCTQVSVTYGKFVQVNTSLHEICSSSFIEQPWIRSVFGSGDWSNLTSNSFYGRGVLYFQGLHSMCYLFQENITQYASHFLSSAFISAQVIYPSQLISQVNDTVEQVKESSRADHAGYYKFARDLQNANQVMSIFSTNWVYSPIQYDPNRIGLAIPLEPVSHGNCSCATSSSCIEPVLHNNQIVPGFVIGCQPMESLWRSTLACLYNQTCIDQININRLSVTPLSVEFNSSFSIHRTVEELIDNALDQQWSIAINYTKFFSECQPANCFYSTNRQRGVIQIIVTLLGLYGGLTVALRTIVPYMIGLVYKITLKCRTTRSTVQPFDREKY